MPLFILIELAEGSFRLSALRVNTDSRNDYGIVRQKVHYKTSMRESRTNGHQNARSDYGGAVDTPTPGGHGQLLILPRIAVRHPSPPPAVTATNVSPPGVQFCKISVSANSRFNRNQIQSKLGSAQNLRGNGDIQPNQVGQFDGLLTFIDTAQGSPRTIRLHGLAVEPGRGPLVGEHQETVPLQETARWSRSRK